MANHSSASVREQTPHATKSTKQTISDAVKRRAMLENAAHAKALANTAAYCN